MPRSSRSENAELFPLLFGRSSRNVWRVQCPRNGGISIMIPAAEAHPVLYVPRDRLSRESPVPAGAYLVAIIFREMCVRAYRSTARSSSTVTSAYFIISTSVFILFSRTSPLPPHEYLSGSGEQSFSQRPYNSSTALCFPVSPLRVSRTQIGKKTISSRTRFRVCLSSILISSKCD